MNKLKLAFVSPLPPKKSGIADYSAELIPELLEYYDLDVIVAENDIKDVNLESNITIRSSIWFKQHFLYYDRVIYHFGNSPYHLYMLDLIVLIPGVVVLHDFYLSHLLEAKALINDKLIYHEYGFKILQAYQVSNDKQVFIHNYPFNQTIINNAKGVIVHSDYSKHLARKHFGTTHFQKWYKIPLLRKEPEKTDTLLTKKDLGFKEDDFLVCCFGLMTQNKLNATLVNAWINSSFVDAQNIFLVFVGEQENSPYVAKVNKTITNCNNIILTDWVDLKSYRSYLSVADIAVQLRQNSRGESSAAILDCMNYSVPTIVNANGATAEIPKENLYMIEDTFNVEDLSEALETLHTNVSMRKNMAEKAKEYMNQFHKPTICANRYKEAIENSYKYSLVNIDNDLPTATKITLATLSTFDLVAQKQILVDVSSIVKQDLKTGIQRVVRSQIVELIKNAPDNWRIEPVYFNADEGIYFYARSYTLELLGIETEDLYNEPICINKDDIFYGLDLSAYEVDIALRESVYENYKNLGVKIIFMIYDLLPISYEYFFPANAKETHTRWLDNITNVADELVCISNTVRQEVIAWLKEKKPQELATIKVTSLHLGADIATLQKSTKKTIQEVPKFLMVGTIEPRKAHLQVLEAFEMLWSEDLELHLTIVGKVGWMVEKFVHKLSTHKELDKRLHFLEAIGDEELSKVYNNSDCIIVASEAEGFGLPLIEAAQHSLALIARDIPIFNEVAKEYAYYFKDTNSAQDLAMDIKKWLSLYKENAHPVSTDMPYLSWKENAKKLLEIFGD